MKHLLLEIVEATEAAALAASAYVGSGDKLKIDEVATDAMRRRLNEMDFVAQVVIGEGKKDGSFGLFEGDLVGMQGGLGLHNAPQYDIAVDPVEGTTPTAKGGYEAMSVIAVGHRGYLFTTEHFYMNKLAVGPEVVKYFRPEIRHPIETTVDLMRRVLKKERITVCMLDRPRHNDLAARLRACGCRIKFIQDCDVSGAIATALPESGIDLFLGIGGAPEGVITAAAIKCLGGHFQGVLVTDKEDGHRPVDDRIFDEEMLARGEVMFAATGITNGNLLKGIRMVERGVVTHSVLMESGKKTLKRVESYYEI